MSLCACVYANCEHVFIIRTHTTHTHSSQGNDRMWLNIVFNGSVESQILVDAEESAAAGPKLQTICIDPDSDPETPIARPPEEKVCVCVCVFTCVCVNSLFFF